MIRRALILANFGKDAVRRLAGELDPWLREKIPSVTLEGDIRAFCSARQSATPAERERDRPDLIVVLGGDGALLGAVRSFAEDPVPTLGINLGRVGFLASTPATRWRDTLASVLAGECVVEDRMRVAVEWKDAHGSLQRAVALNDITLQRDSREGMLRTSLWIRDVWVSSYRADGLIVATPSGSTAYSLSAGGPIIVPDVDAVVVTPICSPALSDRPIVLSVDEPLTLTVDSSGATTLAIDGQEHHTLGAEDVVKLTRHPVRYPLYAMPGLDAYRRLRERLGWGAEAGADGPSHGSSAPS